MNLHRLSIRSLFFTNVVIKLLVFSCLLIFSAYKIWQYKEKSIEREFFITQQHALSEIEEHLTQISRTLIILKNGIRLLEDNHEKRLELYSQFSANAMTISELLYNSYFAFGPEWSRKLFNLNALVQTTHRNNQNLNTPCYNDPNTFIRDIWKDHNYQNDPKEVWYHVAKKSQDVEYTDIYFDNNYMKEWMISAGLGLYEKNHFYGMVGVDVLISKLTDSVEKHRPRGTGGIMIVNYLTGDLLTTPHGASERFVSKYQKFKNKGPNVFGKTRWEKLINPTTKLLTDHHRETEFIYHTTRLKKLPWAMIVFQEKEELYHEIHKYLFWAISIILFSVLLTLIFSIHLNSYLTVPLIDLTKKLSNHINEIKEKKSLSIHFSKISRHGSRESFTLTERINDLITIINENFANFKAEVEKNREINLNLEQIIKEKTIALDQERSKLVQASRMANLGEMAAGIAHEINNPLAIINGNSKILETQITADTLEKNMAHSIVNNIRIAVQRIVDIITGLKNFSQVDDQRPLLIRSLDRLIDNTRRFCEERFRYHQIDFAIAPIPSNIFINCREHKITEAFLNLLNNAFDAVLKSNERKIQITSTILDDKVCISILNTGPSIPLEIRDKIMNPFFTTKAVGQGTGLGLSVALGIIREHGGDLTLDNGSNQTKFDIILPIAT